MTIIADLSKVPAPDIVETLSFEDILARRKEQFIQQYSSVEEQQHWRAVLQLESEPVTKLLEENAYNELLLRQRINESAQAVMLAYAMGNDLDQLAANFQVQRKLIREADLKANPPITELWESDEELRLRTQMAFEGLSVAGPRAAYEFHALSAHPQIADVSAISPKPAYVTVSILSRDGDGTASAEIIQAVESALNDDSVRPIADRVTIQSVKAVPYQIQAQLFVYGQKLTANATTARNYPINSAGGLIHSEFGAGGSQLYFTHNDGRLYTRGYDKGVWTNWTIANSNFFASKSEAALLSQFKQEYKQNGWCKLPNGLIMQWLNIESGDLQNNTSIKFDWILKYPNSPLVSILSSTTGETGSTVSDEGSRLTGIWTGGGYVYTNWNKTPNQIFSIFSIGY